MTDDRQMRLAAFVLVPTAHHQGAWRYPLTDTDFLSLKFWTDLGKRIEDAGFHMLFLPDTLSLYSVAGGSYDETVRYGGQSAIALDPVVVLAAIASTTQHLGLGATLSATFFPPYALARTFATLDHLTGGRAAWNVVMSMQTSEARNFGLDEIPGRNDRYDHGDDYVELCCRLWETWDPDALIIDKHTGVFADPMKVQGIPELGLSVKSPGPLTVPRSPQGRPVIMQAGSSPRGRDFAARWGEVVFCLHRNLDEMRAFRGDIRARAQSFGRNPDAIKVMPALQVVVGETEAIARERAAHLNALVDARAAIATLSTHLGTDLTGHPLDEPAVDVELAENAQHGSFDVMRAASHEGMTLSELALKFAQTELTPQVIGDGKQVADELERLFVNGGCDGFTITPTYLPGSYEDFGRLVVPELRRRNLLSERSADTLRETLGTQPAPLSMQARELA